MKDKLIPFRTGPLRRVILVLGLLLPLGAAFLVTGFLTSSQAVSQAQTPMIPASFAEVAAKASPAVVNISTVKTVKGGGRGFRFHGPQGPDDSLNDFFEKFFGGQAPNRPHKQRSMGSGFIISPEGLIVTNNHVIDGADKVTVRMSDEREFEAKVLGRDPKTDLALIKITTKADLPYLELGDSSKKKLKIGDWVVAIGNPFGLEHTVTAGILSARGRVIGAGPYDDFLQTDASINPGNSGGPLLNLNGEVVGINTAIVAGGSGIGFAIPANMARGIVAQLEKKGRVTRGWLGVMIQSITPELAKSFGLKEETGALVADVTSGGPAEKSGIKRGDVIVSFDGKKIKEWSDLPIIVAETGVGAEVKVKIIRDGKEKNITVRIAALDEKRIAAAPAKAGGLGLTVKELTPELAKRLGLSETKGVVITGIADGSPAAESGLKPGDVIIEINRKTVKDISDYRRGMEGIEKGDTALFLVRRGAGALFFTLKAE